MHAFIYTCIIVLWYRKVISNREGTKVSSSGDTKIIKHRLTHLPLAPHISVNELGQSWWRHQMETFSALLAICAGNSPVPGEFPTQRPVTRSFDVFFDLCLNKRLSKQWWGWWFETLSRPLWRHRNVVVQVMACCLTAPSHYLNQCWLIAGKVPWHSEEVVLRISEDTNGQGWKWHL